MRTILPLLLPCAALAALGETISDVSLVQQWPWSEAVSVDFTVNGWDEPSWSVREMAVVAYDGEEKIGRISPLALSGDTVIDGNGAKHIVLTPSKDAALRSRGRIERFKVALSSEAVADDDLVYIVFDLSKEAGARGARQYVTRRDLTNGVWGAWAKTSAGDAIWTGLADDERYFRERMAFRRIPAGAFTMGHGVGGPEKRYSPARSVTISSPYYISVFETTKYQYRIIDSGRNLERPDVMLPSVNDSLNAIRGDSRPGAAHDWPTKRGISPDSIVGKLGAKTGFAGMFDLPTEAQWEKAARGGVEGDVAYYDGSVACDDARADALAWYSRNTRDICGVRRGGLKAPNGYGLYDTLGNVWEMVLDWQNCGVPLGEVDPVGEPAPSARYPDRRILKGGSWQFTYKEALALYWRSQNPCSAMDARTGSRFVLNLVPYGGKLLPDAAHTGAFEASVRPVEGDATVMLQKVLDDCFLSGGGTITVEKGEYAVGGLRVRSNTTLHLACGAVLKGSRNCDAYEILAGDKVEPVPEADFAPGGVWVDPQHRKTNDHILKRASRWNNAIIRILRAENVRVVGEEGSAIDGCDSYDPAGEEHFRGVHGISVHDSTNCTFAGYTIRNTGNWAHNVWRSADLRFEGLTILGGHDGIHVSTCDRVAIRGCAMKTGDDCVAGFDNEDVTVRGCSLNTACSAFRLGGRRVLVEDCHAWGPAEFPIRNSLPKADQISGSHGSQGAGWRTLLSLFTYYSDFTIPVRHDPGEITVRNCRVENAQRFLHYNFSGNETWQRNRPLRGIRFENVTATGLGLSLCAYGDADAPLSLSLKGCRLSFRDRQRELVRAANVESLEFDGVTVDGVDGPCVRSWGCVAEPSVRELRGVEPKVLDADAPFIVKPI